LVVLLATSIFTFVIVRIIIIINIIIARFHQCPATDPPVSSINVDRSSGEARAFFALTLDPST
jgi:hypothetical protein